MNDAYCDIFKTDSKLELEFLYSIFIAYNCSPSALLFNHFYKIKIGKRRL